MEQIKLFNNTVCKVQNLGRQSVVGKEELMLSNENKCNSSNIVSSNDIDIYVQIFSSNNPV